MQDFSGKYNGRASECFFGSDAGVRDGRLSNAAIFGIQAKTFDQVIAQTQRGPLNEEVREFGYGEDREPTEGQGIEKFRDGPKRLKLPQLRNSVCHIHI
jgi:hypothetical protein